MADEKKKGADPAAAGAKKAKPAGTPPKGAAGGKGGGGRGKGDKDGKADANPFVAIKRTAPPRLKDLYNKEVLPKLMKEFNYTNSHEAPRLEKITLNMGLGEAIGNPKIVDSAVEELRLISRQAPVVNKAKQSIATLKLGDKPYLLFPSVRGR